MDKTEEEGSANGDDRVGAPANRGVTTGNHRGSNSATSDDKEDLDEGYLKVYVFTQVDHCMQAVCGYWVHTNGGCRLTGGIRDDNWWQTWCQDLTVLPLCRYNALGGKVGRRFVRTLAAKMVAIPRAPLKCRSVHHISDGDSSVRTPC